MADRKTIELAQFYEQCQEKGYTDMNDSVQSLKAKVIATDLGISYGNIGKFYQKAQAAYETIMQEKAAEKAEEERIAVNGEFIMAFDSYWKVYRRKDGTWYTEISGKRFDGKPSVYVEETYFYKYTYHGPTSTYNAISVNGITSGWVDNHGDYFSNVKKCSNRGIIHAEIGDKITNISSISLSETVCEAFKREEIFTKLSNNGTITCKSGSSSSEYYNNALKNYNYTHDVVKMMDEESYSKVVEQLGMEKCTEIVMLLRKILSGEYPPTDEELYTTATELSTKTSSSEIAKAIELFNKISDYKDVQALIDPTKKRYEELLQEEKENAILRKEKNKKKRIVISVISFSFILVLFILIRVFMPNIQYVIRSVQLNNRNYKDAMEGFNDLGAFKDSHDRAVEATYLYALSLAEEGQEKAAIALLSEIKDYQDSEAQLEILYNSIYTTAISEVEAQEYEQAREDFSVLPHNYKDSIDYLTYMDVQEMFIETTFLYDQKTFRISDAYKKVQSVNNDELRVKLLELEPIQIYELLEGEWSVQSKDLYSLHFTVSIEDGVFSSSKTDTVFSGFDGYVLVWDNGWYRFRESDMIYSDVVEGKASLSTYILKDGHFTVYTDYGDYEFKR